MTVRPYRGEDAVRWNRFVDESLDSSFYHHAGWKDVIEESFGHHAHYLLSEDSRGEINGILPLVHLKSVLFGNFLVSLPYFNYGGICADSPEVHRRLLEEAIDYARQEKAEHLELRDTRVLENGLRVKSAKVSMRLELPADPAALWSSFSSKLRSQIRRPTQEGMEARIGGAEDLESFYKVFSINMRDLGTPVYSRDFFQNVLDRFPDSTRICTVYCGGEPVASGLLAGFKGRLEIPWASSLRSFNRFSPNMLLYWAALEFACKSGYRVFDFGRSTPDGGTFRFKKQWGAKPTQLYWYYWMRNGGPAPELNPGNPRFAAAIRIWRRLPIALTRLIGPVIVKNLPG